VTLTEVMCICACCCVPGEEAASIPSLPYQLQSGPLGVYDTEDIAPAIKSLNQQGGPELPFELHTVSDAMAKLPTAQHYLRP
jgi:hypothetical protein